jgi:hypothetical protein
MWNIVSRGKKKHSSPETLEQDILYFVWIFSPGFTDRNHDRILLFKPPLTSPVLSVLHVLCLGGAHAAFA